MNTDISQSAPIPPKVSIVIPAYNHERFIGDTIASVLNQTFTDLELIIINDGSRDGTEAVIQAFDDPRIQYRHQENRGAHATINWGIEMAAGDYVGILNSDDIYAPDRIEQCMAILDADTDVAAVFSHVELIDETGNTTGFKRGAEENWRGSDPEISYAGGGDMVKDLLTGNFLVSTSNLFCRRSVFREIEPFAPLRYAHDYDFFLRLSYKYPVRMLNAPLLKYRIHNENTFSPRNMAAADFETGAVLAYFLANHHAELFHGKNPFDGLLRCYHSVNTSHSDRLLWVMFLYALDVGEVSRALFLALVSEPENRFRAACIQSADERLREWGDHQEAWRTVERVNRKLMDSEKKIAEMANESNRWYEEAQSAWKAHAEIVEKSREAWTKVAVLGENLINTEKRLADTAEDSCKWWRSSQEAWAHANKAEAELVTAHEILREKDEEIAKRDDEINSLREELNRLESEKDALLNSRSYKLGRFLSTPARVVTKRF